MDNIFKEKPTLQEYFATSDGTKFYTESMAKNHSKTLEDKTVTHVVRPAEESAKETAADIIAKAPEMDLETANDYLDSETSLEKPRKSVVQALEKRIEELEKLEE
ncbi:hypothetical protein [Chryseobacterium koreense]|uniref:Uncharacterized protein n=1 Tax=Chryseobacterium koreense CCUG 49689 TaxID=1304281 RepID=A0A0J7IWA5_9FLAO|nr:hypothetical protein [Chryseobacterium koreense]KMQ70237.1 hypothetical protein ACM44_13365 [Chryseobacterium koreense CCUG 49689]MBB5334737.1 hypothetical protein [Chryseobacterium koreense]